MAKRPKQMSISEFQDMIIERINNPENSIYIKVKKKAIDRVKYLESIREEGREYGLTDEELDDVVLLVDKTLWGFGVLDYLINEDDTISDIRLVNKDTVRVKRRGKRMDANIHFISDDEYKKYIQFITGRNSVNMSISNAAQVFTDKDSSPTNILRFSLVSDLLNTNDSPTLLIRKIPKKKKTFDELMKDNYLTEAQRKYLVDRWRSGKSILVCGPNGSGKTTFINAVLESTNPEKSCVVIQESEELYCNSHPEMIFRKILPAKGNSSFYYDLKALGTLALMESFDTIVVGEIKGKEAASLAYAAYTGSQFMTSVHSINAKEGVEKIIDYALDDQPNRDRKHFSKQFQTLDTVIYVQDYHISQILHMKKYNDKTGEYEFEEVTFKNGSDEPIFKEVS